MPSLSENNTTVTLGNSVDLVTSGDAIETKSVQVLAMSYMMYKIGTYSYVSCFCDKETVTFATV